MARVAVLGSNGGTFGYIVGNALGEVGGGGNGRTRGCYRDEAYGGGRWGDIGVCCGECCVVGWYGGYVGGEGGFVFVGPALGDIWGEVGG